MRTGKPAGVAVARSGMGVDAGSASAPPPGSLTPGGAPGRRSRSAPGSRGDSLVYGVLLTPYGIAMIVLAVAALVFGVALSVLNIDLLAPAPTAFVGIDNFKAAFSDPTFISSLERSIYFFIVPVLIQVGLGLLLALVLQSWRRSSAVQALLLIPMFVPPVVSGLFWKLIMTPNLGGLDALLGVLGLPQPSWLDRSTSALAAVTIADVWEWYPFAFVVLFAALRGLPEEPFEAARVDGATEWQILRKITLPLMRIPLTTAFLLELVNALFLLPLIYTMTGGGPGQSTEPLDYYGFIQGFQYFNISYAATLLVVVMAIVLIPAFVLARRLRREVVAR